MRTHEERREEIFRRSSERITRRKRRRNAVVFSLIPFIISIMAFAVTVLPAMYPAKSCDPGEQDMNTTAASSSASSFSPELSPAISLEVLITPEDDTNGCIVYGGKEAECIFRWIESVFDENRLPGNEPGDACNGENGNEQEIYVLTFSFYDGSKTVYNVSDERIYNESSGECACITTEILEALEKLLRTV